jgi:hypothetical protein
MVTLRHHLTLVVVLLALLGLIATFLTAITFYGIHQEHYTNRSNVVKDTEKCILVSPDFGLYLPREFTLLYNCSTPGHHYKLCPRYDAYGCFIFTLHAPDQLLREIMGLMLALLHHKQGVTEAQHPPLVH